ncbi:GIY-YIG nuclease family protein [Methylomonas sp. EFPC3]|uniref:GIY-YIG nuclease family protein n=1 Tax=Methylomonas sp. EFPC3 TaxID=3021710 RepID=UPI002415FB82|nr:GIY-YIG nuclease family protein [Methylomonas sp. EFPC3]WFP51646.1 GIY-YIG nuclease family protein [Methylomonas sp. EFPC3]
MTENLISVKEFSELNGLRRQSVFKVIKRLGIEPEKSRGGSENRGQTISYITDREARLVLEVIGSNRSALMEDEDRESSLPEATLYDIGVFYLLGLEPEHDPNRFKVGFANNINERLRQHRCSAPFAKVMKTWSCRRLWEKTAIECVTAGCDQLHTEVFRATSLNSVIDKCDRFFELMPRLD